MIEEGVGKEECDTALGGRMAEVLAGSRCPSVRKTLPKRLTCGHFSWPKVLFAVALALGASVGYGQWLETRITLPDSLGGATGPTCLTTDTSERYVYIGDGSGAIYVVDAESGTRVAKVPCSGYVAALCTSTRQNKIYAVDAVGNQVLVISCATNQVVATIPTGANPLAMCYNSTDDKVYVASYDGGDLTVIECSSDSVIKTMHLGQSPARLCYNPASDRVFCVSETLWIGAALAVIDGASDSVVAVRAGPYCGPFAVNAVTNKVYVGSSNSGGIFVLDGTSGAALDSLDTRVDVMCLNSRAQKLYVGYDWGEFVVVRIYDCTADTLVNWCWVSMNPHIYSIACDTAAGKVYATVDRGSRGTLVMIDNMTDTISTMLPGPSQGELLVSSEQSRVYATDPLALDLAVFDTGTDSLLRTIMIGGGATMMCYDSLDDKVYYVSYSSLLGEAGAIDAATNRPVGHIRVGPYPQDVIWHAPTNRVYCSGGNLTVIDPTADTVTKVLPLNSGLMCSAPRLNKVYVESPSHINVIDCRNDSVTKTIPVPIEPMWSMCYVADDKLYVGGFGGLAVIDCVGDTLIRSYPFSTCLLAASPDGKQVYGWRPYSLSTFDTAGDTLIAEVPWEAGSAHDLLYVPGVNKVYCTDPGGGPQSGQGCVFVADGTTDTLIAQIPVRVPWALGYDSASGLVYCSHALDTAVTFIDSRTDSIVGTLITGIYAPTFVNVPAHNRIYVSGAGNSSLPVIRTDPAGVEEVAQSLTPKKPAFPTVVSKNSTLIVHQQSVMLDAVGRKVLDLKPGLHGLAGRQTGVYFIWCMDGTIVKILLVD
jgi:YVTN family beta-propeller protein